MIIICIIVEGFMIIIFILFSVNIITEILGLDWNTWYGKPYIYPEQLHPTAWTGLFDLVKVYRLGFHENDRITKAYRVLLEASGTLFSSAMSMPSHMAGNKEIEGVCLCNISGQQRGK